MSDQHLSNNSWGELLPLHKKVAAGDGIEWLKKAWNIFTKDFVIWLVAIVAWLAVAFFISLVPFLGVAVVFLTTPILFAGFYYAANQAHQGQNIEFEDFLYGFKNKLQPLLILGVVQFVFYFVVTLISTALIAVGGVALIASAGAESMGGMIASLILGLISVLLMSLISIPFSMAMLYAPILVAFHNLDIKDAMMKSFKACLSNWLAWLVFCIVVSILFALSILTLGLGTLVLIVLCSISVYASYRSIFLKA